jgi:hypothetical protein
MAYQRLAFDNLSSFLLACMRSASRCSLEGISMFVSVLCVCFHVLWEVSVFVFLVCVRLRMCGVYLRVYVF